MTLYLASPLVLALLGTAMFGGLPRVMALTTMLIPFGMLAVVGLPAVGGMSLMAVNCSAATLTGLGILLLLTRLVRGVPVEIEPSTIALALYAAYGIFSATVLVRLFSGDVMVFSLARGAETVRVSTDFSMGKVWLAPGTPNISQTFYVVLGFGFFATAAHVLAHRGPEFGELCLAAAASINVVLGVLDALGLDSLLGLIRTANYALLNNHTVLGLPRIVGGFPEASSFGSVSTVFFAYFAAAFIAKRESFHGWLALSNGILALFALSSTGIASLALVSVFLIVQLRRLGGLRPRAAHVLVFAATISLITLAVAYALLLTEAPTTVQGVISRLILEKSDSKSGVERLAWAMGGLEALRDSWGLGVGMGSIRGNGLVFVALGSVGIAGTLCLGVFLWLAFGPARQPVSALSSQILSCTRIAGVSMLTATLLTATAPDPGTLLLFLAAMAVSAKQPLSIAPDSMAHARRWQ